MLNAFADELAEAGGTPQEIQSGERRHLGELKTIGTQVFDRWAALIDRGA